MAETEEINRKIAEFMGYHCVAGTFYSNKRGSGNWFKNAKYHISYDALMPVVERIEEGNYGFKLCRKRVEVYYDDTKKVILDIKKSNRLESLYHAVYEFITWYNSLKQ